MSVTHKNKSMRSKSRKLGGKSKKGIKRNGKMMKTRKMRGGSNPFAPGYIFKPSGNSPPPRPATSAPKHLKNSVDYLTPADYQMLKNAQQLPPPRRPAKSAAHVEYTKAAKFAGPP